MASHSLPEAPHVTSSPVIDEAFIRRMEVADLDAVVELDRRSFKRPWSREAFTYELVDNPLAWAYVLCREMVLGFAVGWRIHEEAHLATFAISEPHRRHGLGSFLLTYVLERLRHQGATEMHLEVRRSNVAARRLYEKHDFTVVGVRKHYYSEDHEDAILMSYRF